MSFNSMFLKVKNKMLVGWTSYTCNSHGCVPFMRLQKELLTLKYGDETKIEKDAQLCQCLLCSINRSDAIKLQTGYS